MTSSHQRFNRSLGCCGVTLTFTATIVRHGALIKLIEVPFKVDMGTFDFAGKVDLIMTEGKHQKIVEHKTASKIGDSYMERLPLDTQCRAYIFGSMRGLGINPTEIIYDVVRMCQLRKKANEPIEVFNDRIAIDYAARPDFTFTVRR